MTRSAWPLQVKAELAPRTVLASSSRLEVLGSPEPSEATVIGSLKGWIGMEGHGGVDTTLHQIWEFACLAYKFGSICQCNL